MSTRYFEALFNPRSIAIIGASERPASMGGVVISNLLHAGFDGDLCVVNQKGYNQVLGVACVSRVSRLPFVPDLAIICTPPETVPKLVRQLGNKGVKVAMVLTGGLSRMRSLSGRPLMYSMLQVAQEYGMRVLGPNTIGVIVPRIGLNASYAHRCAQPGKIAFIGQSGTLASAVLDWACSNEIGFSYFITLGDGLDIDLDDLIDYISADQETKTILLHLETIKSARRFISAVRAASRGKLVLAVKSGIAPESQWHPRTNPPGVRYGERIFDAVFRRAGVLRVSGTDQMFAALETLSRFGRIRQHHIAIISNGIGPGVMAVDTLSRLDGELTALGPHTFDAFAHELPPYWNRKHPVDLNHDATPERYAFAMRTLDADPNVVNLLVMHTPSLRVDSHAIAEAVVKQAADLNLNIMTCWLGEQSVASSRQLFREAGIPTYDTPDKAIKAFMQLVRHARSQQMLRETPSGDVLKAADIRAATELISQCRARDQRYMNPAELDALLALHQIPMGHARFCHTLDEVLAAYADINGPVNLTLLTETDCRPFARQQVLDDTFEHSLRQLHSEDMLRDGCHYLLDQLPEALRQQMVGFEVRAAEKRSGGIRLSAGITRDETFGPLIFCGAGGADVNALNDRRIALPPLNQSLAKDLLRQTYISFVLKEYSQDETTGLEPLAATLVRISNIAVHHPHILTLELSLALRANGDVVVLDGAAELGSAGELAILPYPEQLRETIQLPKSGWQVELRPIRAEDEPAHARFFANLSAESIRYRFFHYRRSFSHDELAQMTQVDYDREMVFVASHTPVDLHEAETLGAVRAWIDSDNIQAEFSVIVRDDLRGEQLGYTLMQKMIRYLKQRGTMELFGTVLPDNQPMLNLAKRLGFSATFNHEEDVMDIRLALNEPHAEWQVRRLQQVQH